MDIYKFINSRDIRKYLKDINYIFSPEQEAWLIYYSKKTTLEEKYEAWEEVINSSCDLYVPNGRHWHKRIPSLHNLLKSHIQLSKKYVDKYFNLEKEYDDPHCYKVKYWEGNEDTSSCHECDGGYFATFKDACECIKEEVEDYKKDNDYECQFLYAQVRRIQLGSDYSRWGGMEVRLNERLEIMRGEFIPAETEEDGFILDDAFEGQWFEFPTPFEKGDIVSDQETVESNGPLVVNDIGFESFSERMKYCLINHLCCLDNSDMNFNAYYQSLDGTIYRETAWNYMDYEYYKGGLDGNKRVLKALSNLLKGEIEPVDFGIAYHAIILEEHLKETKPWYIREYLEKMGLKKDDK